MSTDTEYPSKKNVPGLVLPGISGAICVVLGAFAAHALRAKTSTGLISPDQLSGFETGVRYQFFHTLALLAVVLLFRHGQSRFLRAAYYLFVTGIVLFSGSLYFLCTRGLTDMEWLRVLGPVTPIGGLCFVAGWLSLCFHPFNKG